MLWVWVRWDNRLWSMKTCSKDLSHQTHLDMAFDLLLYLLQLFPKSNLLFNCCICLNNLTCQGEEVSEQTDWQASTKLIDLETFYAFIFQGFVLEHKCRLYNLILLAFEIAMQIKLNQMLSLCQEGDNKMMIHFLCTKI